MTSTIRSFLPWVRQGLAGSISTADTLGAGVGGRVAVPVEVWIDDPAHERPEGRIQVPLRFHGPGDVTGIDPREIVRVDPPNLCTVADPSQFVVVEFDRPDFPWLFTPARANAGRLRPWIVLVVVERDLCELQSRPDLPLPVLETPPSQLPNLAESWAWAHAQVTHAPLPGDRSSLVRALASQPERTVSRLLAPRRLRPNTAYRACVVPAFAAGRKAGLSEPLSADDETELKPAWTAATGAARVRLPVYYHFEFSTGPHADFESLARQLQLRSLPGVGVLTVDVGAPGWGVTLIPVDAKRVQFAGALRTPGTPVETEAQVDTAVRAELRRIVGSGGGPDVAPPLYGQPYTNEPTLPLDTSPPHWLRELNLDPRTRIAAGLGAMVVRYEQERLMASAWQQLAAHERSVQEVTRAQLSEEVSAALYDKFVAPSSPAQLLGLMGPMSASGVAEAPANGARVPEQNAAYRRLMGPGGVIGRRVRNAGGTVSVSTVAGADGARPAGAQIAAVTQQFATSTTATASPRFAPEFPQPMYEALRDWFEGMLLPGSGQVPPETVALLETNSRFVEAFLVGLNHEFGRELLWRGYPTDLRATYFRRFWGPAVAADAAPVGTVGPIQSWNPASRLGEHLAGPASGTQLVLIIRGQLLTLFPRAVIYAVPAKWLDGATRGLDPASERYPIFRGTFGADGTFIGFDLSVGEARGAQSSTGPAGYFFVIQEQPTEPRFGFDPGDGPARSTDRITNWADLSWADVDGTQPYVPIAHRLKGVTRPAGTAPSPGGTAPPSATWGNNAAHMALIAQQPPFRIAIHASAWLGATGTESR